MARKHTEEPVTRLDEPHYAGGTPAADEKIPPAPRGTRYVGFCRACGDFVELTPEFTCKSAGHGRDQIGVALLVNKGEAAPHMPRVNLGALFMPALWGPAHGQWAMILFYPVWLFLDNVIYGAVTSPTPLSVILAVAMGLLTAAFTVLYAVRANVYGYQRVAAEKTPEEYLATERKWSVLFVAIGCAFLAFATWYNLAVRPGLGA